MLAILAGHAKWSCPDDGDGSARGAGTLAAVEGVEAAAEAGAPGLAAEYLRRALDEPPDPAARPALLLELGLALASERNPAAVTALQQAVGLTKTSRDRAAAALLAARVLGIWGYHDSVTLVCRDALACGRDLGPAADGLEAELFASSFISAATASEAWAVAGNHLADPGASSTWRVYDAVFATGTAQPASDALAWLAPVLAGGFAEIPPDSLAAVYALLVLIWNIPAARLRKARHYPTGRPARPTRCVVGQSVRTLRLSPEAGLR